MNLYPVRRGLNTEDQHDFSVTEVFPDGRVLVFVYVRVLDKWTVVMTVYDDATLVYGERVLYVSNAQIEGELP